MPFTASKAGQTLVVIAHRQTTVEDCDTLIWLEKGRIRMTGPPAKVLPAFKQETVHA